MNILYTGRAVGQVARWLDNWDFEGVDSKTLTHRLHNYPAIFIPQLVRKIITEYSAEGDTVLDIFNGSGTTTLECFISGRKSIGIELNPLAHLLAQVKVEIFDAYRLKEIFCQIKDGFSRNDIRFQTHSFKMIEYWYPPNAISYLSKLKYLIENADAKQSEINFFKIVLSKILREISYCKHSGFKMHRDKNKVKKPDISCGYNIWGAFEKAFEINLRAIISLNEYIKKDAKNKYQPTFINGSSVATMESIQKNSVDLIITSPPYGDSQTTVAYGQFSRLSSQWLELKSDQEIIAVDSNLLGGRIKGIGTEEEIERHSDSLLNVANHFRMAIKLEDDSKNKKKLETRLKDILSFYTDLYRAIKTSKDYIKVGGHFIFVTANRTVKGIKLPTDQIICEFGDSLGMTTNAIVFRNILNKRMPSFVSATNVVGERAPTMSKENIIILKKGLS